MKAKWCELDLWHAGNCLIKVFSALHGDAVMGKSRQGYVFHSAYTWTDKVFVC